MLQGWGSRLCCICRAGQDILLCLFKSDQFLLHICQTTSSFDLHNLCVKAPSVEGIFCVVLKGKVIPPTPTLKSALTCRAAVGHIFYFFCMTQNC